MYKISKKKAFSWQNKFLSQNKVTVTEKERKKLEKKMLQQPVMITETILFWFYAQRNTFLSQKYKREKIFRNRSKFLSRKYYLTKQVSVTKMFLSQKQVSVTETTLVLMLVLFKYRLFRICLVLFLAQNFFHHLFCHLAFFSDRSERTTIADLIKAFLLWEHFLWFFSLCLLFYVYLNTAVWKSTLVCRNNMISLFLWQRDEDTRSIMV